MNAPRITFQEIAETVGALLALYADGSEPLDANDFVYDEAEIITLVPPTPREVYLSEAA